MESYLFFFWGALCVIDEVMEVENENENKIKIWAEAKPKTSVEVYDVSSYFVQESRDVVAE